MAKEREKLQVRSERAVLAAVRLPDSVYDPSDPLGELTSLAEQAGASVVGELTQKLERPVAGSYIGRGKLEELKALCAELDASTIIFDHDLSPRQINTIEKATLRKVIDRSELILDIFASRAVTAEAKLQVELAQLEYTAPRLRAMWNHLERISGGLGSKGPGEMQIELDRRLVADRKLALERELAVIQARRRREVRARKADHCTVGIVGYTNAGKSTLFNTLTAGGAYADDRLFATLQTRTREWEVAQGVPVMLSDTVGFVRDIPTHLVASFKATLEEATHADLLLIVVDIADPAAEMHHAAVIKTLDELMKDVQLGETKAQEKKGASGLPWTPPPRIVLLNKADQLIDNAAMLVWQRKNPDAIPLCALPPLNSKPRLGQEALRDVVAMHARGTIEEVVLTLPLSEAKSISTLERQSQVLSREYDTGGDADTVRLRLRIGVKQLERLRAAGIVLNVSTTKGKPVRVTTPEEVLAQKRGWGK